MRVLRRLLLCATILVPLPVAAQEKAALVADSVAITGDTTLVAEGHVEVFYKGTRLTASRILYDQPTDRLTIDGPIVLDDGRGQIVLADQGALSGDLANVASALWHFEPTFDRAVAEVLAGTFKAADYGVYSFLKEGGCSLAPLGSFEGKVPAEAMALVAQREAAIRDGSFTVAIDDSEPKSS